MILSDDSELGAFIPLKHLYIILTQQNKSSSTFFSDLAGFLGIFSLMWTPFCRSCWSCSGKLLLQGRQFVQVLTSKKESQFDNKSWHRDFGHGASLPHWHMPCALVYFHMCLSAHVGFAMCGGVCHKYHCTSTVGKPQS